MTVDSSLWIRRYNAAPQARVRLACLPHAGGSASFYFPVAQALPPTVDVLSVQYPGRQDRRGEPCIDHLPTLARRVTEAVGGWTDRPLALFGHSMGAIVAFEMARILEREHAVTPAWLFVSGRRAPSRYRDERIYQEDDASLIAELRRLSGTGSGILADEEALRMVLPAVRADYRAAETYQYLPGPPLNCPVTVLIGDNDPKVTVDEARAWKEHTTSTFGFRVFPGGHFFHVTHQADVLQIILDRLSVIPQVRLSH